MTEKISLHKPGNRPEGYTRLPNLGRLIEGIEKRAVEDFCMTSEKIDQFVTTIESWVDLYEDSLILDDDIYNILQTSVDFGELAKEMTFVRSVVTRLWNRIFWIYNYSVRIDEYVSPDDTNQVSEAKTMLIALLQDKEMTMKLLLEKDIQALIFFLEQFPDKVHAISEEVILLVRSSGFSHDKEEEHLVRIEAEEAKIRAWCQLASGHIQYTKLAQHMPKTIH